MAEIEPSSDIQRRGGQAKSDLAANAPIADEKLIEQDAHKKTKRIGDMWWKIGILVVLTVGLIFCVIPIRTHAVLYDPANPPPPATLWTTVSSTYLTSGTVAVIVVILAVAAAVGFWIMRSA